MSGDEAGRTRLGLDGLVLGVELTLLSIIEGLVLISLAEASKEPILLLEYAHWPTIAAGLAILLLFWTRAMIHTFTLIRWPLEYGHNFLYIACALVQSVMMSQVAHLRAWFILGTVFSLLVWVLFAYDLRLIDARMQEASGPAGKELFVRVRRDQLWNVRIGMPCAIVFHAVCAALVSALPSLFELGPGRWVLVLVQLCGTVIYLAWVLRWYASIVPLILRCRDEWEKLGTAE